MEIAPSAAQRLVELARLARENAYAPYSGYRVGAAVLAEDGRAFAGCNVENSSYGLTVCAERNAVAAAVAAGARPVAVAVVAADRDVVPCGACCQVLSEFAPEMPVVLAGTEGNEYRHATLAAFLPSAFRFRR